MAELLTSPPDLPPVDDDVKQEADEDSVLDEFNRISSDELSSGFPQPVGTAGGAGDIFTTKEDPEPEHETPETEPEVEIELPLVKVRDSLAEQKVPNALLSLMFWDDIKLSAAVFASGTILLICLNTISFISVFAYLHLCILVSVWGLKMYTSIQNTLNSKPVDHPLQEWLNADICLTTEKISSHAEKVAPLLEDALKKMREIVVFQNTMVTLRVVFAMYALTYIGDMMNFLTLVLWCFIGLFTVPLVYETKQKEINKAVKIAVSQIQKVVHQVCEKIQPQLKAVYEKMPPVVKSPLAKFLKLENAKTE